MEKFQVEKVMDRKKIADVIHNILDVGIDLLNKDSYQPKDHTKIKLIRTMGGHVNSAVGMVQQETMQLKAVLVFERLKQLGYDQS